MLNPEICKKCVRKSNNMIAKFDLARYEEEQNLGMIVCPYSTQYILFSEEPPDICKYKLEHTVLEQ